MLLCLALASWPRCTHGDCILTMHAFKSYVRHNTSYVRDNLCRTYDIISRTYEIKSRTYDIISRTYDIISRTYEIIMSYVRHNKSYVRDNFFFYPCPQWGFVSLHHCMTKKKSSVVIFNLLVNTSSF